MEPLKVIFEPLSDSSCSPAISPSDRPSKPPKRPIPRKGHTKSRNGCFNCKKRKVKCPETRPECNHCTRIGLRCEYPPARPRTWCLESASPPSPAVALRVVPATSSAAFTLDDMRFFQHFLLKAYPYLPIGGEAIWRDVAQLAHGFKYLIHSMLALAASSLEYSLTLGNHGADDDHRCRSPRALSYSPAALSHRVAAIRLLNDSLSRPCSCPEEATARYAAMMALLFQSSYMADGMLDFVAMTRGCKVVAETAMDGAFETSPFGVFSREGHVATVRRLGQKMAEEAGGEEGGLLGEEVVVGFLGSLERLGRLPGRRSKLEMDILGSLETAVGLTSWASIEAFDQVTIVYALLGDAGHDEFSAFISAANFASQILLVHYFLLECAVASHAMKFARSQFAYRGVIVKRWIENLVAKLPKEYDEYMEWPLQFANTLPHFPAPATA